MALPDLDGLDVQKRIAGRRGMPVIVITGCGSLATSQGRSMKLMLVTLLAVASVAAAPRPKPSIVLVHGAFADASSWAKVIPILERDGYEVTAVQIP